MTTSSTSLSRNRITPFLWFDHQAEEAAKFYVSLFADSRITDVQRKPDGSAFAVSFVLNGLTIQALNGGPHFTLSPAFSLYVDCDGQREVDALWDKFIADGAKPSQCGWLTDRYGLSWQIIPKQLIEWMRDPDAAKSSRVVEAMMPMQKLDVEALRRAHEGR